MVLSNFLRKILWTFEPPRFPNCYVSAFFIFFCPFHQVDCVCVSDIGMYFF